MIRSAKKALFVTAAATLVLVATAAPSSAATDLWYGSQQTSNPTLYQTNWFSQTSDFTFPSWTPANAVITSITYTWAFQRTIPAGTTLQVYLCVGSGNTACATVTTGIQSPSGNGTTTAFAGYSARNNFHFAARLVANNTYVLSPSYPSKSYSVQVNYSY